MNLALSEDQQQLLDSARGMLGRHCDFATRRKRAETGMSFDRALWSAFAEMGWLGIAVPQASGGLGLSTIELCLLGEEFGRAQVLEPLVGCAVLPGHLLQDCAQPAAATLLEGLIDGSHLVAVALSEPQSRGSLAEIRTTAAWNGENWQLDGHKSLVLGGGFADTLLVVARTGGQAPEPDGLTLFAVPATAPGLTIQPATLMDWSAAGDVLLQGVRVGQDQVLGQPGNAYTALQDAGGPGHPRALC